MKTFGAPGSLLDRRCLLCLETQEEHLRNFILRRSDVDGHASGHPTSTRTTYSSSPSCFTNPDVGSSTTPNLIDVNGLGRPKEFSGKEEDFQHWAKKTEPFFAEVIKESEMMLEWAAEQTTEIATELINREFLPTETKQER